MKAKKIFLILSLVIVVSMVQGQSINGSWTIHIAKYKASPFWHATNGEWQFYKDVKFDLNESLVYNKKNQIIGSYWFNTDNNLSVLIDSPELKLYGSMNCKKQSSIMCGTGEIYDDNILVIVKIIFVRKLNNKGNLIDVIRK